MSRTRTITLTEAEATILLNVAGNGCGDGDYFGVGTDDVNKRDAKTFNRALRKIGDAFDWNVHHYLCPDVGEETT